MYIQRERERQLRFGPWPRIGVYHEMDSTVQLMRDMMEHEWDADMIIGVPIELAK